MSENWYKAFLQNEKVYFLKKADYYCDPTEKTYFPTKVLAIQALLDENWNTYVQHVEESTRTINSILNEREILEKERDIYKRK